MSSSDPITHVQSHQTLADLRLQLERLEHDYNLAIPLDGPTQGRRARLAHGKILADIVAVRIEIQKLEMELGASAA